MRSVAKHSYVKGARGKAKAKAHVNYIQYRRGDDRVDGKPREFFSGDREHIQGREVKRDIDESERAKVVAHKLVLSPGLQNVDVKAYTREVMEQVGREKGLDLDWRAVVHKNTDHDHAHVIIFGKDKNGREVFFNRDDYKNMREAGDRYLERNHFYERYLERDSDRVLKGKEYERERGDNIFEALVRDLNPGDNREDRQKAKREPREWDKEKAIEHLKGQEKIKVDDKTYTKFSRLDDLKEYADRLKSGEAEPISSDKYKQLWSWIGTKERGGDDYYERKARENWDKKEEKKRDPSEEDRIFKQLDKDLRKAFAEMERSQGGLRTGYKQYVREMQGRLSAEHGHYVNAMAQQRLADLMERYPDRAEEFKAQLEDIKRFDQEQRAEESKKWRGFDELLGENWRDKDRDISKDRTDQTRQQTDMTRQFQQEQTRRHLEETSGDQTKSRDDRDRGDDDFGRGER